MVFNRFAHGMYDRIVVGGFYSAIGVLHEKAELFNTDSVISYSHFRYATEELNYFNGVRSTSGPNPEVSQ